LIFIFFSFAFDFIIAGKHLQGGMTAEAGEIMQGTDFPENQQDGKQKKVVAPDLL
jgi:hypothetical protein